LFARDLFRKPVPTFRDHASGSAHHFSSRIETSVNCFADSPLFIATVRRPRAAAMQQRQPHHIGPFVRDRDAAIANAIMTSARISRTTAHHHVEFTPMLAPGFWHFS
jgi:hypothetical protein